MVQELFTLPPTVNELSNATKKIIKFIEIMFGKIKSQKRFADPDKWPRALRKTISRITTRTKNPSTRSLKKKKSNGVQRPNCVHAPIKVFSLLKEKNKVSGVIWIIRKKVVKCVSSHFMEARSLVRTINVLKTTWMRQINRINWRSLYHTQRLGYRGTFFRERVSFWLF